MAAKSDRKVVTAAARAIVAMDGASFASKSAEVAQLWHEARRALWTVLVTEGYELVEIGSARVRKTPKATPRTSRTRKARR